MVRRPTSDEVQQFALAIAFIALFPGLTRRGMWWRGRGARGVLLFVAYRFVFLVLLRIFLLPWAKRKADEVEAVKATLREELGREPTADELTARL